MYRWNLFLVFTLEILWISQSDANGTFLDRLRSAQCENFQNILKELQFANYEQQSPFPNYDKDPNTEKGGFDTTINLSQDCYVIFLDDARTDPNRQIKYNLQSMTDADAKKANSTGNVLKTHDRPCGACSTLDQLALYIENRDFTDTVRQCGVKAIMLGQRAGLNCLQKLGFMDACKYIYYYNILATKNSCQSICMKQVHTPHNVPNVGSRGVNYCKPFDKNAMPSQGCKNTINGAPACSDFQWKNGPYRLNDCLQCDECRSGPLFQKVAGRTRRDSGLEAEIARPPKEVVRIPQTSTYYGIVESPVVALNSVVEIE